MESGDNVSCSKSLGIRAEAWGRSRGPQLDISFNELGTFAPQLHCHAPWNPHAISGQCLAGGCAWGPPPPGVNSPACARLLVRLGSGTMLKTCVISMIYACNAHRYDSSWHVYTTMYTNCKWYALHWHVQCCTAYITVGWNTKQQDKHSESKYVCWILLWHCCNKIFQHTMHNNKSEKTRPKTHTQTKKNST